MTTNSAKNARANGVVTPGSAPAVPPRAHADVGTGWLAVGAVLSALLASTCCVLPLALVMLGIGGAWVSTLTAFAPYQPYAVVVAVVCLAAGLWRAYRPRRSTCKDGTVCSSPGGRSITRLFLWLGVVTVLVVLTDGWWSRYLS